jgi:hypothetical protein
MNHSRMPQIVKIPIGTIIYDPPLESDHHYNKLYKNLVLGKIKVGLTRLPLKSLKTGFFIRRDGNTKHISELKHENISYVEKLICGGHRPALELYWSPLAPSGGGYVCPDDEVALAAYANLKFAMVPCRILKPIKVNSVEASVWIEKRGEHTAMAHVVAPVVGGYASIVGLELPPFKVLIAELIAKCATTRAAITAFHADGTGTIHYHQMLHAFLRRHEKLLDSIDRMIFLNRIEHAEALARVAYEAFLNFYIDWLSPEFFGPRLQFLSAIRTNQSQGARTSSEDLDVLGNFTDLFENARQKGNISPLGPRFHNLIYPPLSLTVHQSYGNLENEASSFDDNEISDFASYATHLGRWMDVLTAAIVCRIQNEVGLGSGVSSHSIESE